MAHSKIKVKIRFKLNTIKTHGKVGFNIHEFLFNLELDGTYTVLLL